MLRFFRINLKRPQALIGRGTLGGGQLRPTADGGSQAQGSVLPNGKKDGSPSGIAGAAVGII